MNLYFLPGLMIVLGVALIGLSVYAMAKVCLYKKHGGAIEEFTVAADDMDNLKEPKTHLIRKADSAQEFMLDLGSKSTKPGDSVKLLYAEGKAPLLPNWGEHICNLLIGLALIVLAVLELIGYIRVL